MNAKSFQSCQTLCISTDYSPPGSSVLQARILEWVAISSSQGSNPHLMSAELVGGFFTIVPRQLTEKVKYVNLCIVLNKIPGKNISTYYIY